MDILHRLCLYPKFTLPKYRALTAHFGDISAAWTAEFNELTESGFDQAGAHDFLEWRDRFNEDQFQYILDREGISIISIEDPRYSHTLKNIFDPPVCLFVRGDWNDTTLRFAIVGTRKMTIYGKQTTEEISEELARNGVDIVSGLALGIDAVAHRAALKAGGRTTAVLGTGVDRASIYPRAHYELSQAIIDGGGVIISEYPPRSAPTPYSFPRRNRIIAGISLGVLVIEADEKSGALITATCALEYGRDVYAIPHVLTSPTGAGPHKLIREGAYLARGAHDILEHLHISEFEGTVRIRETIPDTPEETQLLQFLSREPVHIDEIVRKSVLSGPETISMITLLEMKGRVKNVGNMMYILKK